MKKRVKYRMGIRAKVVLFICLTTFILIAVGVGLGYFWGYNLLRDTVGKEHLEMAGMLAVSISEMFDREIETIETFSESPLWKKAIRESNLKYETMDEEAIQRYLLEMDKRWIKASDEDPLIKEYIENKLDARLKVLAEGKEDIGEIFITDRVGGLVAASGRTTDFYQADEEWWQKAFADGKGKVFIGKLVFDESANILSIPFAVPIKDRRSGKVIGICKAVVECKSFFAPLEDFKIGKTGHAVLTDKKNDIIFHYGIKPLTMKFFRDEDYRRFLKNKREWRIVDNPHIHKEKMFVACTDIKHPLLLESGITWKVWVDQDAKEVFAPLKTLLQQTGILAPILIMLLVPLAFIFGGIFVKPLRKLQEGTERIGRGDLGYKVEVGTRDEIEGLANSFNKMSEDLRKTTTSVNNLNKEIVERKEAENKAKDAMNIKSEFTSMVSHELRTPLTAIKEGIGIVLDGTTGKTNAEQKDFLELAKRNVDRLARLINDVLDFQKIESGRMEFNMQENDINEVVKEVQRTMTSPAKEKGLNFILKPEEDLPKARFDKDKITQVLTNIVDNAIKFTERGNITITTAKGDNNICVSVQDTGPGIKEEYMPRLFHKFEQMAVGKDKRAGGTGLGLAISREIIEKHKGSIWAESEIGKGAIFHFTLPLKGEKG